MSPSFSVSVTSTCVRPGSSLIDDCGPPAGLMPVGDDHAHLLVVAGRERRGRVVDRLPVHVAVRARRSAVCW